MEIAGQDLTDPTTNGNASGYANFAHMDLFVDGAQYNDVAQGAVGDCYLLASLSSLADTDPTIIEQMVAPLGDGTFAVRFHRSGREVYLRVDADLPVYSNGSLAYAKFSPDGEIWVPLTEKAYAYFRYGQNSYSSIHGGWMSTVYREITDQSTQTRWTGGSAVDLFGYIQSHLAAGHAVSLGSYSSSPSPIVGSHAYVAMSVQSSGGVDYVTVYNPWGYDGRSWDGNYSDGLLTISMAHIQQSFSAVVVSLA